MLPLRTTVCLIVAACGSSPKEGSAASPDTATPTTHSTALVDSAPASTADSADSAVWTADGECYVDFDGTREGRSCDIAGVPDAVCGAFRHSEELAGECDTLDAALEAFGFPDPGTERVKIVSVHTCEIDGELDGVVFTIEERVPESALGALIHTLIFDARRDAVYGSLQGADTGDLLCCGGDAVRTAIWGSFPQAEECRWEVLPDSEYDSLFGADSG